MNRYLCSLPDVENGNRRGRAARPGDRRIPPVERRAPPPLLLSGGHAPFLRAASASRCTCSKTPSTTRWSRHSSRTTSRRLHRRPRRTAGRDPGRGARTAPSRRPRRSRELRSSRGPPARCPPARGRPADDVAIAAAAFDTRPADSSSRSCAADALTGVRRALPANWLDPWLEPGRCRRGRERSTRSCRQRRRTRIRPNAGISASAHGARTTSSSSRSVTRVRGAARAATATGPRVRDHARLDGQRRRRPWTGRNDRDMSSPYRRSPDRRSSRGRFGMTPRSRQRASVDSRSCR